MNKIKNFGIDVGNSDTKSVHTTLPTGYKVCAALPYNAPDYLMIDNKYYVSDLVRFPFEKDKSTNERCFYLTLMSIAKEILFLIEKKGVTDKEEIQKEISKYERINLGVGLPPAHMSALKKALHDYYIDFFKNLSLFEYNGFTFKFTLENLRVYPQDYAAVVMHQSKKADFISKVFEDYYAVDFGGYTVDVVPVMNGAPIAHNSISLPLGILKMYEEIITTVERDFSLPLKQNLIEAVLKGKPTILPDNVVAFICAFARDWSNKIINELRQAGVEFEVYPVIFLGGGFLLLKTYILENKLIRKYDIIANPNTNACGYKRLLDLEFS